MLSLMHFGTKRYAQLYLSKEVVSGEVKKDEKNSNSGAV
jgi:hypothetical protein